MTDFYLITGFLGAGKTTFLGNFLPHFKDKKVKLIINEFGNSGVDGSILKKLDAQLEEICGGSIFCSCKLDRFEKAIDDCLMLEPNVIIVEASGLSDPTNIKKILNSYEEQCKLAYKGCICLVDAVRFHKFFQTARVCKRQLAVSNLSIINKVDLVDEVKVLETENLIKENFPMSKILKSSFGKVEIDINSLKSTNINNFDIDAENQDITLQKYQVSVNMCMSLYELDRFINLFAEDTARIKGYVYLKECGNVLVDCTGPLINVKAVEVDNVEYGLNVLATKGQNTRKALKNAIKLYSDKVNWE